MVRIRSTDQHLNIQSNYRELFYQISPLSVFTLQVGGTSGGPGGAQSWQQSP